MRLQLQHVLAGIGMRRREEERQTLIDGDGDITRLAGPVSLVVSGDGRHLYVAANVDNAIVRFERLSVTSEMFSDGFED